MSAISPLNEAAVSASDAQVDELPAARRMAARVCSTESRKSARPSRRSGSSARPSTASAASVVSRSAGACSGNSPPSARKRVAFGGRGRAAARRAAGRSAAASAARRSRPRGRRGEAADRLDDPVEFERLQRSSLHIGVGDLAEEGRTARPWPAASAEATSYTTMGGQASSSGISACEGRLSSLDAGVRPSLSARMPRRAGEERPDRETPSRAVVVEAGHLAPEPLASAPRPRAC